jgi:hypothetical protein
VRRPTLASLVTLLCVGGAALFVFVALNPTLIFRDTLTAGGDTGAHVLVAAYLKQHLLPHGEITGWSPDWFAGFPMLVFYFPLPELLVVGFSYLVAYGIAFKLVTIVGLVGLPVAAWAFGRLGNLPRPLPECLALATLPFLFDTSSTMEIAGGNIPSTLAGEYDFAIALVLILVFLGVTMAGLRTGRHRALAAVLLGAATLSHIVPVMFGAWGAILLVLFGPGQGGLKGRLRWGIPVGVVGATLAGFWLIPFAAYLGYTTNMGWVKVTTYAQYLAPPGLRWGLALAAVGALFAFVNRRPAAKLLVALAVSFGAAFILMPQAKLYNLRLLPFWVLCVYLLAGVAVAEIGLVLGQLWDQRRESLTAWPLDGSEVAFGPEAGAVGTVSLRRALAAVRAPERVDGAADAGPADRHAWPETRRPAPMPGAGGRDGGGGGGAGPGWRRGPHSEQGRRRAALWTPVVVLAATLVGTAIPLYGLPSWSPVKAAPTSYIPSWVSWNYTGYQGKATWPEYHAVMEMMSKVGAKYGCGRAMWEYEEPELNSFGTPMSLMLLPYWTGGCIDSMEGLLFESSATTPYHFLNQAELSANPSEAMVGLPYGPLDVPLGVEHLQLLGVRYFMAFTPLVEAQAAADPALKLVATSGPWLNDTSSTAPNGDPQDQTWRVYLVRNSAPVTALSDQPVVMTGLPHGEKAWLAAALPWYLTPTRWHVPESYYGPKNWLRVPYTDPSPPAVPVAKATVSDIVERNQSLSFNVSRTGTPILVKTSYFPNWKAKGAAGPYRVTPNEMVVVPTSRHVVLRYGTTRYDELGWALTALAIVAIVGMSVADQRTRRRSAANASAPPGTGPGGGDGGRGGSSRTRPRGRHGGGGLLAPRGAHFAPRA